MAAEDMGGYSHNKLEVQRVRVPTYTVIDEASFNSEYWPKIDSAINVMLSKRPGESFQLSYEDLFSIAYKCATQQFSEQMFARVMKIVDAYTSCGLIDLAQFTGQEHLQRLSFFLKQFIQAVDGMSSIFGYVDRNYIVQNYGKNMSSILYHQLSEKILTQSRVFDTLQQISEGILEIDPQIVMTVIKDLYSLNEEFAKFNMTLFARFIPNIEPPLRIDNLPLMVEDTEVMQQELNENRSRESMKSKRKADAISEELNANQKRIAKSS